MKVFSDKTHQVTTNGQLESSDFNVSDGGKLVMTVLRNAYSNPIAAVVRELSQNASEVDPNFKVHLPTIVEPWFSVIDNGTGLSNQDMVKYFSSLGASTKDTDNTKVGGFGIGCKVPFTYTDNYQVISRFNGKKTTFIAYLDEYQKPVFTQTTSLDTDEVNGIEVQVPVNSDDFYKFSRAVTEELHFFDPFPECNIEVNRLNFEVKISKGNWSITQDQSGRVIMGNLSYKIDYLNFNDYMKLASKVIIRLPIGSCSLPLSREGLLYDNKTMGVLEEALESISSELEDEYFKTISNSSNLCEALINYNDYTTIFRSIVGYHFIPKCVDYKDYNNINEYTFKTKVEVRYFSYYDLSLTNFSYNKKKPGPLQLSKIAGQAKTILLCCSSDKKKPSTIKYNYDLNRGDFLFVLEVEDHDYQSIKDELDEYGFEYDLFEDLEVPPIKKSNSKPKREVSCYEYPAGYVTSKELPTDLDNTSGLYIESRKGINKVKEYRWREKIQDLRHFGVLPEEFNIFVIPGNIKNTLAESDNYLSVDEAIELGYNILQDINSKYIIGVSKLSAYEEVLRHYKYTGGIDISGNSYIESVWVRYKSLKNKFGSYEMTSLSEVNNKIKEVTTENIRSCLRKKYPLLRFFRSDTPDRIIKQYIMECEK